MLSHKLNETKLYSSKEIQQLATLEIVTVFDLLTYFPLRYAEEAKYVQIANIQIKQNVTLIGKIVDIENSQEKYGYKKIGTSYTRVMLDDGTGQVLITFWSMPFVNKLLKNGDTISVSGTVEEKSGKKTLNNPKLEKETQKNADKFKKIELHNSLFEKEDSEKPLTAIYRENKIIKNGTIKKCIERFIASPHFAKLESIVPVYIEDRLKLPNFKNAILMRHFPKNIQIVDIAKKYFAFQEIFIIQVYREREKFLKKDALSYKIISENKTSEKVLEAKIKKILPFKLTGAQEKVMEQIVSDMKESNPMSRLVEGDVGSGKTIVALLAAMRVINTFIDEGEKVKIKKRLQVALMAPTEVLASQHFDNFTQILKEECQNENIHIALLAKNTGKLFPSKINKNTFTTFPKPKIRKYLEEGHVDILIGTQAVIQKSIKFKRLALLIIDEQHRFGIKQRKNLIERTHDRNLEVEDKDKIKIPHLLSMSATPIPRSLALTIYGDLDLSIIDELPPGRKRAQTLVSGNSDREEIYRQMYKKLKDGKQAYIICAKVEETESDEESLDEGKDVLGKQIKKIKNVKDEYIEIQKRFPDYEVGLLYGKQPKLEKEKVLEKFYKNEMQILVSTSVVEVGVSVANATFMIIENAERFGLSQLHQLRGRVERSSNESLCYLVTSAESEKSVERLVTLSKSSNGFELAEIDLMERGAGALIGRRQSGLTDIGMEAIKNRKLVEIAKQEAKELIADDPNLEINKNLIEFMESLEFHEE
jgi:ATP-dependent DNA helicase RecG